MAKRNAPQRGKPKRQTDPASETWNALPWRKLEQHVYRIQKRIYQAKQRDKTRTVQKLQKLLMKSKAAQLIAVRRVTQENQGKKTAVTITQICGDPKVGLAHRWCERLLKSKRADIL
jgi:RNA-directed DNA polymerase